MAIYRRDEVLPDWEPIPWTLSGEHADAQEREFHLRAGKAILWSPVPLRAFPSGGLLGQDRSWFVANDVAFVATVDGEDLVLIDNTWFGFPDPPRWGLATRPADRFDLPWRSWGHFPDLPQAWSTQANID
ncbi:MAG: hypothetical protein Q8L23_01950 [Caulobacter sp.]|nr:hypothetical protein [Caulobacter sp.]